MALCNQYWNIINNNLFIEGVKFWRAGHFNMKTGEEFYMCSELRRTKCHCMALVRYFKKVEKSVPLPPPSNVPSARVGDHAAGGKARVKVKLLTLLVATRTRMKKMIMGVKGTYVMMNLYLKKIQETTS